MNYAEKIREEIAGMVSRASGMDKKKILSLLEKPPEGIEADFALPCFVLSRDMKKDPTEISSELAEKLKPGGSIKEAKSVGPYLNFYLDWGKLSGLLLKSILKEKDRYGSEKKGKRKIMVEFAHPNTHKAFHIGHVRNISLGESLCRILEFNGINAIRSNYQGDIGPHVAKCLWGYINVYKKKPPARERGRWLGDVNRKANRRFAGSEKVQEEVAEINRMLYAGDKKIMPVWRETRKWSLDYFKEIYRDFGTKFDRLYFETEVEKPGKRISEQLLKRGIAKRSEGAIVMDLKKYNLGVWVLLTRDNISLYSAKDLALAELQVREYNPEKIVHVVGSEQTFHFRQLFKALELTRPDILRKKYHLRYELVNLPSGKMKSREGKVILYEELKKKAFELALKATKEKNPGLRGEQLEKTARLVALGALKYNMLMQSPEKVIIFEWKKTLDFQGNSAPYLQYTHARASSILRKGKVKSLRRIDGGMLKDEREMALVKKFLEFPETVANSGRDFRPHYIANYVYDLATMFNEFYQSLPVLKAERKTRKSRLALVMATKTILKNALFLLGIESPERM